MNLDRKNIEKRLEIRAKVKACTIDDLVNVSQKYLFNESKKSVIAGENYIEEMKGLNFKIKKYLIKKIKNLFSLILVSIPNIVVDIS